MGVPSTHREGYRHARRLVDVFLQEVRRSTAQTKSEIKKKPMPLGRSHSEVRLKELIEPHLFYVVQLAGEYQVHGIAFEDLLAEGNMGLVEAAHRFDPKQNVKFLTYASWWIRKRILEFLAREGQAVRLTRYARERRKELRETQEELRRSLGREPSPDELASASGLRLETVLATNDLRLQVFSLDQQVSADSPLSLSDTIPDNRAPDPAASIQLSRARRVVHREVARLPQRERMIIESRFGLRGTEPMTFDELGSQLGVSRERARQIEREALLRLRRRLAKSVGSRHSRNNLQAD